MNHNKEECYEVKHVHRQPEIDNKLQEGDRIVTEQRTEKCFCQSAAADPLLNEKSGPLENGVLIEIDNGIEKEWTDDEDNEEEGAAAKSSLVSWVILAIRGVITRSISYLVKISHGYLLSVILLLGYLAYFIAAMCYRYGDEGSHRLLGCTIIGIVIICRRRFLDGANIIFQRATGIKVVSPLWNKRFMTFKWFLRWILYGGMCGVMVWVIVDKAIRNPNNLRSLPGIVIILLLCLFFSTAPNKINFHTIFWSVGLQFLLALYVLRWQHGKASITWIQNRIDEFFDNAKAGSKLMFGENYAEHYMIFGAFPLLFFINGMMTVLYYCGAMQLIINVIGNFLTFVLGTSPVESMAVTAGIFLEGIASLTAFKPYVNGLTRSQLFLVITSCFSSIGSAFLAILNQIGISVDLVLGAMIISAPATFTVCKLLMPETSTRKHAKLTDIGNLEKSKYPSALDAFQTGATAIMSAFANICVSAYALVSLISWVNHTFQWFGDRVGVENLTIELIASYVLFPVPLLMGVTLKDCRRVATVYGYRLGSSNIIAFLKLAELRRNRLVYENYLTAFGSNATLTYVNDDIILDKINKRLIQGFISETSEAILTYSLCGFASLLSVAIHFGIICAFLPKKKRWLSRICLVALVAGNLANILTGCFACLFY